MPTFVFNIFLLLLFLHLWSRHFQSSTECELQEEKNKKVVTISQFCSLLSFWLQLFTSVLSTNLSFLTICTLVCSWLLWNQTEEEELVARSMWTALCRRVGSEECCDIIGLGCWLSRREIVSLCFTLFLLTKSSWLKTTSWLFTSHTSSHVYSLPVCPGFNVTKYIYSSMETFSYFIDYMPNQRKSIYSLYIHVNIWISLLLLLILEYI